MKFVALVSGGKDSILSTMMATAHGHELVCIAQLVPAEIKREEGDNLQEIDSPCFQTVGHHAVQRIAECLEVPLRQGAIYKDQTAVESLYYQRPTAAGGDSKQGSHAAASAAVVPIVAVEADEVEVMFKLLEAIKAEFPEITAVSSGAILSDYQRTRVENCCSRLNLTSLAFLWQLEASEVLDLVDQYQVDARLIKTSTMGLDPRKHCGKSLTSLRPYLKESLFHIAGEGGEFESLVLDAPCFLKKKLQFSPGSEQINMIDDNPYAPTGHLLFTIDVVEKTLEEQAVGKDLMAHMASLVAKKFEAKSFGFREYLPVHGGAEGASSDLRRRRIPKGFVYSSYTAEKEGGLSDAGSGASSDDEAQAEAKGHQYLCKRKEFPGRFMPKNLGYDASINLTVKDLRDDLPLGSLAEQCTELLSVLSSTLSAPPRNPSLPTGAPGPTPLDSIFFVMIHVPRIESFAEVNKAYVAFFAHMPPARAFIEWKGGAWGDPDEVGEEILRFDVYSYNLKSEMYEAQELRKKIAAERGECEPEDDEEDYEALGCISFLERKVLHVQGVSQWSAPCIGPYAQSNKVGPNVVIAGRVGLVAETSKLITATPPSAGGGSSESQQQRQFDVEFCSMMESSEGAMRCMGLPLGWLDITHVTFFITSDHLVDEVKKTWPKYFTKPTLPIKWLERDASPNAADVAKLTEVQGRIVVVTALPAKAVIEVVAQSWPCGANPFFQHRLY